MPDYTVSSTTAGREEALAFEAKRVNKTKVEILQEVIDQYLDSRIQRLNEVRKDLHYKKYEALSPADKAAVDRLIKGVP